MRNAVPRAIVADTDTPWRPELAELRQRVERLEADAAAHRPPDDGAFVQAIAAGVEGRVFSARELRAHGRLDAELARALHGLSVVQIGRRLRAVMGRNLGGLIVERVGRDAGGVLWCVVSMPLHADARLSDD